MFVKVKSSVFINALYLASSLPMGDCLRGLLRDEKGCKGGFLEKQLVK